MVIEEHFEIEIKDERVEAVTTVKDLYGLLQNND